MRNRLKPDQYFFRPTLTYLLPTLPHSRDLFPEQRTCLHGGMALEEPPKTINEACRDWLGGKVKPARLRKAIHEGRLKAADVCVARLSVNSASASPPPEP
jgi:hypothetical protein